MVINSNSKEESVMFERMKKIGVSVVMALTLCVYRETLYLRRRKKTSLCPVSAERT